MRRAKRKTGFFKTLLINILLNPEGLLPAAVLVVLHFVLGWSLWWVAFAAVLWLAWLIIRMMLFGWAIKCGDEPNPLKKNKNPYSSKNKF